LSGKVKFEFPDVGLGHAPAEPMIRESDSMDPIDALGYGAAVLTTFAFLPQVLKAWKSRSTKDLSMEMLLLLTTGAAAWLLFGALKGSAPIVLANAVTLAMLAVMVALKLKYR